MKNLMTFGDELTCTQMPPHIGIGHAARCQHKKAENKHSDKSPPRLQERIHVRWIIPHSRHKVESAGLNTKVS